MKVYVSRKDNHWAVVVDDCPGLLPGRYEFKGEFNVPVKVVAIYVNLEEFGYMEEIPFIGTLPDVLVKLIDEQVQF